MRINLTSHEKKIFLAVFISLSVWFNFLNSVFQSIVESNFIFGYIIFVMIYLFLLFRYIIPIETAGIVKADARTIIGWFFVFLALDMILYPVLVSTQGCPGDLPFESKLSSDIFICALLPDMPGIIKYNIIYVIAPTIFLIIGRLILSRRGFSNAVQAVV